MGWMHHEIYNDRAKWKRQGIKTPVEINLLASLTGVVYATMDEHETDIK